jgi:hypothetical protein
MPSSNSFLSTRLSEYKAYLSTEATMAREQQRVANVLAQGSKGAAAGKQNAASVSQRNSAESSASRASQHS